MRMIAALFGAACVMAGTGALAGPKRNAPKPAKLIEVRVCPIMGHRVEGTGGGSTVYGKYRVHFCCGGCKPAFATLTKAEKERKIAIALKKQNR